jgi:hypothetical protein
MDVFPKIFFILKKICFLMNLQEREDGGETGCGRRCPYVGVYGIRPCGSLAVDRNPDGIAYL